MFNKNKQYKNNLLNNLVILYICMNILKITMDNKS